MKKVFIIFLVNIIFFSFLTILLSTDICCASGNTLHVGSEQPYSTIQSAINDANSSDTVYIHSGTYYENVVIAKNLTITGENKNIVIIDGGKISHVIYAYGSIGNEIEVFISDLTIRNAGGTGNDCIAFSYVNNGEISNNIVLNSDQSDGIQLDHCSGVTISDNLISNNQENGINLISCTDNTIAGNNQIQNNQVGIRLYFSSNNNVIYDNTISGNTQYGVRILQSINNRIYLNDFSNNGGNAHDSSSNFWSYNSQGNYWDDYSGKDENPDDGIGDTPYDIPGGSNQDEYPLGYFGGEQPTVNQPPAATIVSITPNPANSGENVSFSGSGSDSDGSIISYNWRSDKDGQLSAADSFITSGLSSGTHNIYFKVKDNNGDWSTEKSSQLVVNQGEKPTATIVKPDPSNIYTATQGNPVEFHGYGVPSEGLIIEKYWRSSIDGVLSSEYTFTKSDLSVGIHNIYFKVRDSNGWSDEVTITVVIMKGSEPINEPPVADVGGPYLGYTNISVSFDGSTSSDPDGNDDIISYLWDFGDGTNGTGITVGHTFINSGNYTVKLTITDTSGLTNVSSTYVYIQLGQNGGDKIVPGIPGFEILFVFFAVIFILIWKKRERIF